MFSDYCRADYKRFNRKQFKHFRTGFLSLFRPSMAFRKSTMSEASKLEGTPNYSAWSFKLRNMMTKEDTWKLVEIPAGTIAPNRIKSLTSREE